MDILTILTVLQNITFVISLPIITIIYLFVHLFPILFLYWSFVVLCKKIGNWIDDFKKYMAKMICKKPTYVRWDRDNFTKELKAKKAWAKKHPILHIIKESYWWIRAIFWYRVPDYPYNIKLHIKRTYQRAKRGWADSDTWRFHSYLSEVIQGGCKHLVKTKHGIPMSAFPEGAETDKTGNYTDVAFDDACKRWEGILQKIIKTFKTAEGIAEHHWFYQRSDKYDQKEADKHIAIDEKLLEESPELWLRRDLKAMTLEECKEYEEGWKLFQEHYFGLSD